MHQKRSFWLAMKLDCICKLLPAMCGRRLARHPSYVQILVGPRQTSTAHWIWWLAKRSPCVRISWIQKCRPNIWACFWKQTQGYQLFYSGIELPGTVANLLIRCWKIIRDSRSFTFHRPVRIWTRRSMSGKQFAKKSATITWNHTCLNWPTGLKRSWIQAHSKVRSWTSMAIPPFVRCLFDLSISSLGVQGFPTSILVGSDGMVKEIHVGGFTPQALDDEITPYLQKWIFAWHRVVL